MQNDRIQKIAKEVIQFEINALNNLKNSINLSLSKVVKLILNCKQGKVIISGVGKSGIIARKWAATFSSTGTPSFFLDATNASHGDMGQITSNDVVILISNSGQSDELKNIIQYTSRNKNINLIGVTSKKDSVLYKNSNVTFQMPPIKEAGPENIVPTSSTSAQLALGDALGHHVGQIRQEAIGAIGDRYIPELQRPLSRLLKDPDADLRERALVLLEQCSERSFGSALLGVIKEPDCIKKPIEEQEKLFHALSRFPNASTMSFFREVLSDKNITRSSIVQQRQLIIVDVLKEINTDDAFALLEQLSKSWLLASAVKESIKNALKTRK